jgi:SAM-dependent methyltransferase
LDFDETGKVALDHLYTHDDPRPYFGSLQGLDYCIPQLAKPYFAKLIQDYRAAEGVDAPIVLDVGCSYGINAALLRCDATIDELYERYTGPDVEGLDREELLVRDRAFVRSRRHPERSRFVGLDSSGPALAYARATGLLDGAVHADLESDPATPAQREQLAAVDLVISTGCIGYVTERTIRQVADAAAAAAAEGGRARLPWMAHFVLRMYSYEPVAEALRPLGYETIAVDGLFKQRRFASPQEQSQVLASLTAAQVDPEGLEADGWLYAQLHMSLPTGPSPRHSPEAAG